MIYETMIPLGFWIWTWSCTIYSPAFGFSYLVIDALGMADDARIYCRYKQSVVCSYQHAAHEYRPKLGRFSWSSRRWAFEFKYVDCLKSSLLRSIQWCLMHFIRMSIDSTCSWMYLYISVSAKLQLSENLIWVQMPKDGIILWGLCK